MALVSPASGRPQDVRRLLSGQLVLVTGGTRGIGKGIVLAMAEAGAHVVVTGRDDRAARAVADEVRMAGGQADHIAADLSDDDAVDALIPQVAERFGSLDVLVNNAGIDADNLIVNHPLEDWRRVMRLNLEVPFRLSKAAAPHFLEKGKGSVIHIASVLGLVGSPESACYTAAKHGLIGLTKVMAIEWASQGIRVNAIAPGLIQTDLTQYIWGSAGGEAYVKHRIPAQRIGQPRDIGGAAVFLASDAADFIHGEVIAVDGGFLAT